MKTVSLEMAKRLATASLTPKFDRWQAVYLPDGSPVIILSNDANYLFVATRHGSASVKKESVVWAPILDDLLDWLEGEGYQWYLTQYSGKYEFGLKLRRQFYANTRADAVGEAVLHVLGRKGEI